MDESLLQGVFSVQLGFASPAQAMAAAAAYVADHSRTVAERLQSDGALDAERRALLESVVKASLAAHGGSPKAALSSVGGEAAVFKSFGGSIAVDGAGKASVAPASNPSESLESDRNVLLDHPGHYAFKGGDKESAEIGRGGIGRVLVAFDEFLGREVAVKELLPSAEEVTSPGAGVSKTSAQVARFLREARVTGQLEHPNIVPVYEVGKREDGTLYYVMRLVRGRTLSSALRSVKTLPERLTLLAHYLDLCNAVAYAHSRGVIHRDLKPENVMLGEFGETVVLDWGLAKVKGKADTRGKEIERDLKLMQGQGAGKTMDGAAIGTPAYMPPEQADGAIDDIDEKSDVWSLGAVLYELLTGRPPFEGATPFEVMGKVLKDAVVPPREVDEAIRPELSAIAAKAMSRDKKDRYESAKALAGEIRSFIAGGRIAAYEYSSWELLTGFVAKNRAVSALACAILAVVVGASVLLFGAYRQAEHHATVALQNEIRGHLSVAAALQDKARLLLGDANLLGARIFAAASLLENPHNPKSPLHASAAGVDLPGAEDLFVDAYSVFHQAGATALMRPQAVVRAPASVSALLISADGATLVSAGDEKAIRFWDMASGESKGSLDTGVGSISALALSTDGKLLASGHKDGSVRLWSWDERALVETFHWHSGPLISLAFSPDGRRLGSSSRRGRIVLWELEARREIELASAYQSSSYLAFSPDGQRLALTDPLDPRRVRVLNADLSTKAVLHNNDLLRSFAFSSDGRWLVAEPVGTRIPIWDLETSAGRDLLQGHTAQVLSVAFLGKGDLLASTSADRTLRLWHARTLRQVQVLEGHGGAVRFLVSSPRGERLATAQSDGLIRTWSVARTAAVRVFTSSDGTGQAFRAVLSPDGSLLAASGANPTMRVWDVGSGALRHDFPLPACVAAAFAPDGKSLAVGCMDETLRVFDLQSGAGRTVKLTGLGSGFPLKLMPTADGALALCLHKSTAVVDGTSGAVRMKLEGTSGAALSPDGRTLAVAYSGGKRPIELLDLDSKKVARTLASQGYNAEQLQYSHAGRLLAVGETSGRITVWNLGGGEPVVMSGRHELEINHIAFSPDDRLLASASSDHTLRVWSVAERKTVLIFRGTREFGSVSFTPDGKWLVADWESGAILIPLDLSVRDADPGDLLSLAEREAGLKREGFALVPRAP